MLTMIDVYSVTMERSRYFITCGLGHIIHTDMPFAPSESWKAASIYTSRGAFAGNWRAYLESIIEKPSLATFKNGKPRFHLGDIDHGTSRVQGEGIMAAGKAIIYRHTDGRWRTKQ